MQLPSHFDFIIIGNGLAGLQLALKLSEDSFFDDKEIALIDPSEKNTNDKTWSFWEKAPSQWTSVIHKSWNNAVVWSSKKKVALELSPYTYNSVRALDFYRQARKKLDPKANFHFIIDTVTEVNQAENAEVIAQKGTYTAGHVFDSRIPDSYDSKATSEISITQHFKGWIIKTEKEVFNDNEVIMMDYRLKDGEQTNFTYVLPFSKTEALVEFTYFTEHVVDESHYDRFIKQYISEYLNTESYEILENEYGQIPMTTFDFSQFNTAQLTKIGTGGGWVKGSTGYSFKLTEKKVDQVIKNLKANRIPSHGLFDKKYRFYDKIFLKVLKDENHLGEWIFQEFYSKNSIDTMFRFLDEESKLTEDLKVMFSLFSLSFIKALFKTL